MGTLACRVTCPFLPSSDSFSGLLRAASHTPFFVTPLSQNSSLRQTFFVQQLQLSTLDFLFFHRSLGNGHPHGLTASECHRIAYDILSCQLMITYTCNVRRVSPRPQHDDGAFSELVPPCEPGFSSKTLVRCRSVPALLCSHAISKTVSHQDSLEFHILAFKRSTHTLYCSSPLFTHFHPCPSSPISQCFGSSGLLFLCLHILPVLHHTLPLVVIVQTHFHSRA
jgi:hypothetical protein